ncbi:hypothetical protein [Algoriphagus sp. CAU 1675]|uniref:hypothetical protein n=1 Tax=Algoriphagus sp. CAU 1675 TaxID=3032597 RepID=UPI0023D9F8C9|nr:hypothetical protein [Algoriphagus sp. CAU 1675]MDF2157207.1 hypothetical protein [Algoriphagus sp. CAU 1675]
MNLIALELEELRKLYRGMELLVLILMIVALPLFGGVYLYYNSGNLNWDLPALPEMFNGLLAGASMGLLIAQYLGFHRDLKKTFQEEELSRKFRIYVKATKSRFWMLFGSSIITTLGLLFFQNPVHVVLFAVTLVFFSLGKPTPDRMKRLMKLSKEQGDLVRAASRPE